MIKFLLDANLSPKTAFLLRNFKFDTRSITEESLGYLPDEEVVDIAKKENRIIITYDLDFGEIYHAREEGKVGIIVLRIKDQTVESVNKTLDYFLKENLKTLKKRNRALVVVKESSIRWVG